MEVAADRDERHRPAESDTPLPSYTIVPWLPIAADNYKLDDYNCLVFDFTTLSACF